MKADQIGIGEVIIFSMRARYVIGIILLVILIVAGLVTAAWFLRPRLLEVYPARGARGVPVTSQIQLSFSRPMDHTSVMDRITIEPSLVDTIEWEGNKLVISPNSLLPGGTEISVLLREGARAASWLAFPMQAEAWSFNTGQATLAYLWPSDGAADIYALDPYTGEVAAFTQGMGVLEFSASWDGLRLYFSAVNGEDGADLFFLDRNEMSNTSGNPYPTTRLLECGVRQCRNPVASPDGNYLAYEQISPTGDGGEGSTVIKLVHLPGQEEISVGVVGHETVQPSWSSKGWLAYYDQTSQSYELFSPEQRDGGKIANQTGQPGCWSPDGQYYLAPEIYYLRAGNSERGTSHLLRYDIQQGVPVDLSIENDVEDVEGCYSPGGEWIAFARKYLQEENWSFGRQLWVMASDGSNPHAISEAPNFNHYDLAWSRDGKALAYVRFDQVKLSDPPELWMVNVDGSNPIQLVIGGFSPLWIP